MKKKKSAIDESQIPQSHLDLITKMGYSTDGIQLFSDEGYIIEGDILITISHIDSELKAQSELNGIGSMVGNYSTRQAYYGKNRLVDNPKCSNIVVKVEQDLLSADNAWGTAFKDAITAWNGISNHTVKFVYSTTADYPDIRVYKDYSEFNSTNFAVAAIPQNGIPGSHIYINPTFTRMKNASAAHKKMQAIHLLGHAIGFAHSNTISSDGVMPDANYYEEYVPGTAVSSNVSVMAYNNFDKAFTSFSVDDIKMTQYLYEKSTDPGTGDGPGSETPKPIILKLDGPTLSFINGKANYSVPNAWDKFSIKDYRSGKLKFKWKIEKISGGVRHTELIFNDGTTSVAPTFLSPGKVRIVCSVLLNNSEKYIYEKYVEISPYEVKIAGANEVAQGHVAELYLDLPPAYKSVLVNWQVDENVRIESSNIVSIGVLGWTLGEATVSTTLYLNGDGDGVEIKLSKKISVNRCPKHRDLTDLKPVYALYSNVNKDTFWVYDYSMVLDYKSRGYERGDFMGYIYKTPGPGRLPLYKLWNNTNRDIWYCTDKQYVDSRVAGGDMLYGIDGYLEQYSNGYTYTVYNLWGNEDKDNRLCNWWPLVEELVATGKYLYVSTQGYMY